MTVQGKAAYLALRQTTVVGLVQESISYSPGVPVVEAEHNSSSEPDLRSEVLYMLVEVSMVVLA